MSSTVIDPILVDSQASSLAFRAGQLVEHLLVDRGIELADSTDCSIVTAEHVQSCLDQDLFDHLLRLVSEGTYGETAREDGVDNEGSREAA